MTYGTNGGWPQLTAWAAQRNIALPEDGPPPAFVVAVFVFERLHNTWRPPRSTKSRPIRLKTAEMLVGDIISHCRTNGWDHTHLKGTGPVRAVLAAARTQLPSDQVQRRHAKPLTDLATLDHERGDIGALIDALDIIAALPETSPLWVARQRAMMLTQYGSALRISSLLVLDRSSIEPHVGTNGTPVAVITDWHPKGRPADGTTRTTIWCACTDAPARCALHALTHWLALVDEHAPGIERVFPTVYKLNPFLPIPLPQHDTPRNRTQPVAPARQTWRQCIDQSHDHTSSGLVCGECVICGAHNIAPLAKHMQLRYPCPGCRSRLVAARAGKLVPTNRSGHHAVIVDEFEQHLRGGKPDRKLTKKLTRREIRWLSDLARLGAVTCREGETISTHGHRSGHATKLAALGASDIQIAAALHHASAATSIGYIDEHALAEHHPLTTVPGLGPDASDEALPAAARHLERLSDHRSVQPG